MKVREIVELLYPHPAARSNGMQKTIVGASGEPASYTCNIDTPAARTRGDYTRYAGIEEAAQRPNLGRATMIDQTMLREPPDSDCTNFRHVRARRFQRFVGPRLCVYNLAASIVAQACL